MITDLVTTGSTKFPGVYEEYVAASAVTRGKAVAITSSGTVAHTATATLHLVIGVAFNSAAAGEIVIVQTGGFCDYAVTAAMDAPVVDGTGDVLVVCANAGAMAGATMIEANTDDTCIGLYVVGKNLAASTGTGTIWIGAGGSGNLGAIT